MSRKEGNGYSGVDRLLDKMDEQALADVRAESKRLRKVAENRVVITDSQVLWSRHGAALQSTHAPHALRKSEGFDVVKKNAPRKARYLVMLPGAISLPDDCANVGKIIDLDTPNPGMELHVPGQGTLLLRGTLVRTANTYLTMKKVGRAKSIKSHVRVQDVLHNVLLLSEWQWIESAPQSGDKSSRSGVVPTDTQLGESWISRSLQEVVKEEAKDVESHTESSSEDEAVQPQSRPARKPRAAHRRISMDQSSSGKDDDEEADDVERDDDGMDVSDGENTQKSRSRGKSAHTDEKKGAVDARKDARVGVKQNSKAEAPIQSSLMSFISPKTAKRKAPQVVSLDDSSEDGHSIQGNRVTVAATRRGPKRQVSTPNVSQGTRPRTGRPKSSASSASPSGEQRSDTSDEEEPSGTDDADDDNDSDQSFVP
ncbi:DNA-binding protein RHL1 [Porphyridium purpureum]|uniref:DNA-binding protein RHL1 n=1 Tax=Porphyridium purpureum TaxID=35688 RepID=A0A5J4YZP4_PORPP|nr:DNA-binding protein RHL1 [Porphyridium purpureum]|eukprot:POR7096..scf208_2